MMPNAGRGDALWVFMQLDQKQGNLSGGMVKRHANLIPNKQIDWI